MTTFHIGVDGGGTNTRAAIVNSELRVLGRGEAASSNLYNVGLQNAVQNVRDAVVLAAQAAHIDPELITSWGLGLAGTYAKAENDRWCEALKPLTLGVPFVVGEDVEATLAGAFGPELRETGGAVLIAGTGANCYGRNPFGETCRVDGLGPMLGDRGSGYWIAEMALRAACTMIDRDQQDNEPLAQAVQEHFRVSSLEELIPIIYSPNFRRDHIAALVPGVVKLAEKGDVTCLDVLEQAGIELARTAGAVLKTLDVSRLALVGGLLDNVPFVRTSMERELRESHAEVELLEPRYEPVVGAALFGMSG